ncbi:hypothetical protein H257_17012 [Aphanomyces astaci]|uniref:Uncharacterized protein n=1 Tax=Aphanomyces astaci TaxID=112090 RepID=W4FIE9_APHAT|nr:hypothetical protein H257_17012 [Aphanomyces astaci]ETV66581.1 hypothetical protein H257_17012 [Aphanomyces astaci]|eukprot:XP_009843952.1 hypothetical protein H257_17012 [Aphanomyces astaci]
MHKVHIGIKWWQSHLHDGPSQVGRRGGLKHPRGLGFADRGLGDGGAVLGPRHSHVFRSVELDIQQHGRVVVSQLDVGEVARSDVELCEVEFRASVVVVNLEPLGEHVETFGGHDLLQEVDLVVFNRGVHRRFEERRGVHCAQHQLEGMLGAIEKLWQVEVGFVRECLMDHSKQRHLLHDKHVGGKHLGFVPRKVSVLIVHRTLERRWIVF